MEFRRSRELRDLGRKVGEWSPGESEGPQGVEENGTPWRCGGEVEGPKISGVRSKNQGVRWNGPEAGQGKRFPDGM